MFRILLRNFSNLRLPQFAKCLSEEILKAFGPFYLVPGEVKYPTQEQICKP